MRRVRFGKCPPPLAGRDSSGGREIAEATQLYLDHPENADKLFDFKA